MWDVNPTDEISIKSLAHREYQRIEEMPISSDKKVIEHDILFQRVQTFANELPEEQRNFFLSIFASECSLLASHQALATSQKIASILKRKKNVLTHYILIIAVVVAVTVLSIAFKVYKARYGA